MGILHRFSYSRGRKEGVKDRDAYWKPKYKELQDEKVRIEKDFEEYRKVTKNKRILLEKAVIKCNELLAQIKGLELFIKTSLEKQVQAFVAFPAVLSAKISELEEKSAEISKLAEGD